MILVPVASLKTGMIVAKNVDANSPFSAVPLLVKGTCVTTRHIAFLERHGVTGIYVEMKGMEDICEPEARDPELKNRALQNIQQTFEAFSAGEGPVSTRVMTDTLKIAQELAENALNNPDVMFNLLNLKNHHDSTYTHSLCVSLLSVSIGVAMGYDRNTLQDLSSAALLHDIGKVKVSEMILSKPARLTDAEFTEIKKHPGFGRDIVEKLHALIPYSVIQGVNSHHERVDGSGYPEGLVGDDIHPFAKIIAIADVFDALTSNRSYRDASTPNEAIEYIMSCAGTHFDMWTVEHFLRRTAAFPIGSMVKLSDGRSGVVVKNNPVNTMRPVVRVKNENVFVDIDLIDDPKMLSLTIVGLETEFS